MSSDTIKSLAIGLISVPQRPAHYEAMLDCALITALATYSAYRPLAQAITATATPSATGMDEAGAYSQFSIALTTGITYATKITIAGEHYKHRLISVSSPNAIVRVYASLSGSQSLAIWQPTVHAPTVTTWPAHHEAIIALITASFYLNAIALADPDYRRSELIQSIAAAYYGRAVSTLQSGA